MRLSIEFGHLTLTERPDLNATVCEHLLCHSYNGLPLESWEHPPQCQETEVTGFTNGKICCCLDEWVFFNARLRIKVPQHQFPAFRATKTSNTHVDPKK